MRRFILFWVITSAVVVIVRPASAAPVLSLRVSVDHGTFLPGEPMLVGVSVENSGDAPFQGLAPLSPRMGFLKVKIFKDGTALQWTAPLEAWAFSGEGWVLDPGEARCEVHDILQYFGVSTNLMHSTGTTSLPHALPPGGYVIRISFDARLNPSPDMQQVVLNGNDLRVSVLDSRAIPELEWAALGHIGERGPRIDAGMWARLRGKGLLRSRYLPLLAEGFLSQVDTDSLEKFLSEYITQGGGPLAAASVLRSGYYRYYDDFARSEAWLARMHGKVGAIECYVQSLLRTAQAFRKASK